MHSHASLAVESGRNPDNMSVQQVLDEMEQHLIPEQLLIPAAVLEVVRLQQKGYGLVVNH
jgi:hypothetical protein